MSSQPNSNQNMFRILVASDVHLGYAEKDKIRGQDSFTTFEEVLRTGKEMGVDLVLLGGDLFHDNKPTQTCMQKCTELLRKYCFGDGDIEFKLVSNQRENFRHTDLFPYVNYEDENLNVSMPVFTIHGNHDDPVGKSPHCYLEVLSAAGLINYFGKYMDMDGIDLHPLLLTKGITKLAMYGLGSLPEERLHRFFKDDKIKFLAQADEENWFNLFVVHQNRIAHTGTKYLPEKFLTSLPDLVIWGHEHESITKPDYNTEQNFHVYQPGSTVITSLSQGESEPKHAALLEIFFQPKKNQDENEEDDEPLEGENQFQITPIRLVTHRQFMFATKDLDDIFPTRKERENSEKVMNWCNRTIDDMVKKAVLEHSGDKRQPSLPLIRLRVESSNTLPFSLFLLKTRFTGKVANPDDIVLFKLKKAGKVTNFTEMDTEKLSQLTSQTETHQVSNIEDIVKEYFDVAEDKSKLRMMDEESATLSVKEMVDKESIDSIPDLIELVLNDCREFLVKDANLLDDREEIEKRIKEYKLANHGDPRLLDKMRFAARKKTKSKSRAESGDEDEAMESNDDGDDDMSLGSTSTKSNKSARGKGKATAKVPRGRGTKR